MSLKATTKEKVILISEKGILYRMPVKKISLSTAKSTGTSLSEYYPDKIIGLFCSEDKDLFFISKYGRVKKLSKDIVYKINKLAGTTVMKLDEGDVLINVFSVSGSDSYRVNTNKREFKVKVEDIPYKGKSAGGTALASAFKGGKGKTNNIIKVEKI